MRFTALTAITLVAAIAGCASGIWFEGHYGDPVEIRLKTNMESAEMVGFYLPYNANLQYMYFDGNVNYTQAVKNGRFPPRCRNVPEGSGCVDWFNPGEKDWDAVLKSRPSLPIPPKTPPALWEKALSKFEENRVKP